MTDPFVALLGASTADITWGAICLRLGISVLLGAIVGCERASKRHSAGLRTFMLLTFSATLAMLIDIFLARVGTFTFPLLSTATVIGAAMLSGHSILFSSRNQIKGLTTSVALFTCALLGLACGAGFYTVALVGFALLLCCLSWFPSIEIYLKNRSNHFEVHLELVSRGNLQDFVTTLRRLGVRIDDIEVNPAYAASGLSVYSVSMTIISADLKKYKTHAEIIAALRSLDYVYYIEEMN